MPATVSILIACYNAGPWLSETLRSALDQTWPDLEVILVDDGSTDNSLQIAQTFADRGLRVISQKNQGHCAACNHALRESRGQYIKFLDADDLINPTAVERQMEVIAGSTTLVAHGEWSRFVNSPAEADFTRLPCWRDADPVDWATQAWTGGQPMHQCGTFLIPKSLLDQTGGWDERLTLIDDFEFFARVLLASGGIRFTPGALLYYRSSGARSLSRRTSDAAWLSAFRSVNMAVDHLLAREDSPRTRQAGADCLMEVAGAMCPWQPDLVAQLESRSELLGGTEIRPEGGRLFQFIRSTLGWKRARHVQEFGRSLTRLSRRRY